jgi:hypothetical protein
METHTETKKDNKTKRTFYVIGELKGGNSAGFSVGFIEPPYIFDKGRVIDEIRLHIEPHNTKKEFSIDMTRKEANQMADLLKQASISKIEEYHREDSIDTKKIFAIAEKAYYDEVGISYYEGSKANKKR